MKAAVVHIDGAEVARRFAHRIKLIGFGGDGMRIAFDIVAVGYVVSKDGSRPPRAECYRAAGSQREIVAPMAWKQFCEERGIVNDPNEYREFRRGFLYGMYLAYRHACPVILRGQPRPDIGTYLQSTVFEVGVPQQN